MRSHFEVSENSLSTDDDQPLEPSRWGPVVLMALMVTLAACSAALLVQ
jgi:hypothetical protein